VSLKLTKVGLVPVVVGQIRVDVVLVVDVAGLPQKAPLFFELFSDPLRFFDGVQGLVDGIVSELLTSVPEWDPSSFKNVRGPGPASG